MVIMLKVYGNSSFYPSFYLSVMLIEISTRKLLTLSHPSETQKIKVDVEKENTNE